MIQPPNIFGAYLQGTQARQAEEENALLKLQREAQAKAQAEQQGFDNTLKVAQEQRLQTGQDNEQGRKAIEDMAKAVSWVEEAQAPEERSARLEQAKSFYRPVYGEKVDSITLESLPILKTQMQEQIEKWSAPQQGTVNGQPGFFQVGPNGQPRQVPGVQPPAKAGIQFTTPDGSTVNIGGDAPQPLTKGTTANLEEVIVNSQAGLDRLRNIQASWKPEYSTIPGRVQAAIAGGKDLAGMQLSPDEQALLAGFSEWRANTLDNLTRHIKDMTGSAMGVQEAARITASMPNEKDGPTGFKSKMDTVMRNLTKVQARAYYTKAKGLQLESVRLEQMDKVIQQRGDQLEQQFKSRGMSQADAEAAAMTQVKREFGM